MLHLFFSSILPGVLHCEQCEEKMIKDSHYWDLPVIILNTSNIFSHKGDMLLGGYGENWGYEWSDEYYIIWEYIVWDAYTPI